MEFLFGKDLRTIRKISKKRELPLGMDNILHIVSRICAGLDYSHNLKDLQGQPLSIIHRDINPQNILVTYEGQVKIIDYGIAKAASQNNKTRENLIKGKLAYMSPEQASGRTIDARSDIFATGIILYELLAARRMLSRVSGCIDLISNCHLLLKAESGAKFVQVRSRYFDRDQNQVNIASALPKGTIGPSRQKAGR